jgi:hypothetical protein
MERKIRKHGIERLKGKSKRLHRVRQSQFTRSKLAAKVLESGFLLESIRKVVSMSVKELEIKLSGQMSYQLNFK